MFQESWLGPPMFDARKGTAKVAGHGQTPHRYVATDDVAALCAHLVVAPDPPEVEFGGPEEMTQLQVVAAFEAATGRTFNVRHLPRVVLSIGHRVLARVQPDMTLGFGLQLFVAAHESTWDDTPLREAVIEPRPASEFIARTAGAVAVRGAGLGALVRAGADHRGRLRPDQLLQHRRQQPAHQPATIGGLHRLDQREQGRLIQGHRVCSSREFLRRYSQRLTRWSLDLQDRHQPVTDQEPQLHHSRGHDPPAGRGRGARVLRDRHAELQPWRTGARWNATAFSRSPERLPKWAPSLPLANFLRTTFGRGSDRLPDSGAPGHFHSLLDHLRDVRQRRTRPHVRMRIGDGASGISPRIEHWPEAIACEVEATALLDDGPERAASTNSFRSRLAVRSSTSVRLQCVERRTRYLIAAQ